MPCAGIPIEPSSPVALPSGASTAPYFEPDPITAFPTLPRGKPEVVHRSRGCTKFGPPISLPLWDTGPCHALGARPTTPFSIIAQMDGIMNAILGVRLERDVCATSAAESRCITFGRPSWLACSTFVGLYEPRPDQTAKTVAMAASHHAFGLFVVPVWPDQGPSIVRPKKQMAKTIPPEMSWFQLLRRYSLLEFNLCSGCDVKDGRHGSHRPFDKMGFVANFDYIGKMKARTRIERVFTVCVLSGGGLPSDGKLGVSPFCPARTSPIADALAPTRELDTLKASPSYPVSELLSPLPTPKRNWNLAKFESFACAYPFPDVADMARNVVAGGIIDSFVGDPDKAVVLPNSKRIADQIPAIREKLMKEVFLGNIAGPFDACPFPSAEVPGQPRTVPLSCVPKHKHDPMSNEIRLISNFSAGGEGSVNNLIRRPRFIAYRSGPRYLRERIAEAGIGANLFANDVPSCFRGQNNPRKLLHLFVYTLPSRKGGTEPEYYVDLQNPFGWRPSEFGWTAVLAVLCFVLQSSVIPNLEAYVDNFFIISPREDVVVQPQFRAQVAYLKSSTASVGIKPHEEQDLGNAMSGLGWEWSTSPSLEMICPEDKYKTVLGYIKAAEDPSRTNLSLETLRILVGLFTWYAAGFPILSCERAPLIVMRTQGEAVLAKARRRQASDIRVEKSVRAQASLSFVLSTFVHWNRRCPIYMGFGARASWQVLGQVDASTDFGCGGFAMFTEIDGVQSRDYTMFSHGWSQAERESAMIDVRESTGILELRGTLLWLATFGSMCAGRRVEIQMDNASAVLGLESGFSDKPKMMELIRSCRRICIDNHINLRVRHILGIHFNGVADALSHDRVKEAVCLAATRFGSAIARTVPTKSGDVLRL